MAYTPNSLGAFIAAYAGAISGMAVSGRVITDPTIANYAGQVTIAFAFAQEFDTLFSAPPTTLAFSTIQEACEAVWQNISPSSNDAENLVAGTFAPICDAIISLLQESSVIFALNGVPTTAPIPGVNDQVKTDFLDTTPGFLADKLLAGTGITLTVTNPGGNEQLSIAAATGPIAFNGGSNDESTVVIPPNTTTTIESFVLDTTGLGVEAVILTCTGTIGIAAAVTGTATLDCTLDGNPLSPPVGCEVVLSNGSIIPFSFSGQFALSEGPHTILITCSAKVGTTATINPAGANHHNTSAVLLFLR